MHLQTIVVVFVTLLHHTAASSGNLASVFYTACVNDTCHASCSDQRPNVLEVLKKDDRLRMLAAILKAGGLESESQQPGSVTVFAPTNSAFAKIPAAVIQRLSDPKNKDELIGLLMHHVIADKALTSSQLAAMTLPARLETLAGEFVTVTKQGNQMKINNATVLTADLMASNGVVHVIDTVLIP